MRIKSISLPPFAGHSGVRITVGVAGVTGIMAMRGLHGKRYPTWYRVSKGDQIAEDYNAVYLESITYFDESEVHPEAVVSGYQPSESGNCNGDNPPTGGSSTA